MWRPTSRTSRSPSRSPRAGHLRFRSTRLTRRRQRPPRPRPPRRPAPRRRRPPPQHPPRPHPLRQRSRSPVDAVVLVGGFGTRLRPLTLTVPKNLVPVAGVPLIERVIAHLAAHGIDRVVLSLGYRP